MHILTFSHKKNLQQNNALNPEGYMYYTTTTKKAIKKRIKNCCVDEKWGQNCW